MKITVSVHGRYHAFELARGLLDRGLLDRLVTTYPAFAVKKVAGAGLPVRTAPMLELRRRLWNRLPIGRRPDHAIAAAFGRFAATEAVTGADMLIGWSGATLEAIEPARALGTRVVIERGSTHIRHQTEALAEAYREFGLVFDETDPRLIVREEAEYELADAVSVPSQAARASFLERGVAAEKILVNQLGVDLSRFQPPKTPRPTDKLTRIVFAGGVGIRKGIPWLLRAFAPLKGTAELHLLGPVGRGMEGVLAREQIKNVVFRGPVPMARLAQEYGNADIFCLPSIEEGFGLVVPQAMACGLPVVVTSAVGAADLVEEDVSGRIVPPADPEALQAALAGLIEDAEKRRNMGAAARARVEQGCGWDDYVDGVVRNLQDLTD